MSQWLHTLLTHPSPAAPSTSLEEHRARHVTATANTRHSLERAALGGLVADRLGFAFASGYQEALRQLVPGLPDETRASLCVTEEGGNHPRAIQTMLHSDGRLDGHKTFATLASQADVLLVLASTGVDAQGRNQLRLVRLDAHRAGVEVRDKPPIPFAPEISHADVVLRGAVVQPSEILPGDGFEQYVKPFRTVEDLHVMAAATGHLVGVARRFGWPRPVVEQLLAHLCAMHAMAGMDVSAPSLHVALAGVLGALNRDVEELTPHWSLADEDTRTRWQRDVRLLKVAESARSQRRERAWGRLTGTTTGGS